jgi:hypothetical protein
VVSEANGSTFDESTRPRAPRHPGATATPAGLRTASFLLAVHQHLRHELAEVIGAVGAAVAGDLPISDARTGISEMTMLRNYRELGSFCGNYCALVSMHHTIEDQRMLVELAALDSTLQPVVDRLSEEHSTIHGMLVNVDRALARLMSDPSSLADVESALAVLEAALLSHLRYEEDELIEPIGRLSLGI